MVGIERSVVLTCGHTLAGAESRDHCATAWPCWAVGWSRPPFVARADRWRGSVAVDRSGMPVRASSRIWAAICMGLTLLPLVLLCSAGQARSAVGWWRRSWAPWDAVPSLDRLACLGGCLVQAQGELEWLIGPGWAARKAMPVSRVHRPPGVCRPDRVFVAARIS